MPPPPPPPRKAQSGAASKEENIYIPSFISKRPFYAVEEGDDADYLKHQRREEKTEQSQWYDRGKRAGPAATKYRKGACENCGALTHKAKDCLSRPRARGAKWTGKDIQADEVIQDVKLGWDAKRDRWNGYDTKEYRNVVDEFNQMEDLRREAKRALNGDEAEDEGDKYAEENDMSKHQSTATRQLRIREDTAKYLLNLDLESAKYDPKTRSLVNAGATGGKSAALFAEEGFLKSTGEAADFEQAQRYAWEAQERSGDTLQHLQANPTAGAFSRKKEQEDEERRRAERDEQLRARYGGGGGDGGGDGGGTDAAQRPAAMRAVAVTESEAFVEYDESGLVKGAPRQAARSRYAEDVLVNNHGAVWGSWWSSFRWGYACCHSLIRNSYCTGEQGREAWEAAERHRAGADLGAHAGDGGARPSGDDEPPPEDDDEEGAERGARRKGKMRAREEMLHGGVTEAELEEYRRKRTAAEDPMAKLLGKDELLS